MHAIAHITASRRALRYTPFGTVLDTSLSLISSSIALKVLRLLLTAVVAGRVIAMWIVSQISRENKPKRTSQADQVG